MDDINHIWTVICKESIINQDDNVISLLGVLEELTISIPKMKNNVEKLPDKINIPLTYEVVSYWIREGTKAQQFDIKMTIISPDGEELSKSENPAIFPENTSRLRSRLKIQGFLIKNAGKYFLNVFFKDKDKFKHASRLPIEVKINRDI